MFLSPKVRSIRGRQQRSGATRAGGGGGGSPPGTLGYPSEFDIAVGVNSSPYPDHINYPEARAFVSCEGPGANATGWRSSTMKLGLVTNLNSFGGVTDEGGGIYSGSLDSLLEHAEPMFIIPLVSGYINRTTQGRFLAGNKHYAGQFTLPGTKGLAFRYTSGLSPNSMDIMLAWDGSRGTDLVMRYFKIYRGHPDGSGASVTPTGIAISETMDRTAFDQFILSFIGGDDPITHWNAPQDFSIQHYWAAYNLSSGGFARAGHFSGGADNGFVNWPFFLRTGARAPSFRVNGAVAHLYNYTRGSAELISQSNLPSLEINVINSIWQDAPNGAVEIIILTGKQSTSTPTPFLWLENLEARKEDGTLYRTPASSFWTAVTRNHHGMGQAEALSGRSSFLLPFREVKNLEQMRYDNVRKGGGMWARNPLTGALIDRRDSHMLEVQQYGINRNLPDLSDISASTWTSSMWPTLPEASITPTEFFDNWFNPWKQMRGLDIYDWNSEVPAAGGMKLIELFAADCVPDLTRINFDTNGNPVPL